MGGGGHLEADKTRALIRIGGHQWSVFFLVTQFLITSLALAALYQSHVLEHTEGHRLVDLRGKGMGL